MSARSLHGFKLAVSKIEILIDPVNPLLLFVPS